MSSVEKFEIAAGRSAYDSLLALDQCAWDALPLGLALFNPDGRIARLNGRARLVWHAGNEPIWHATARRAGFSDTASAVEQALRFGTACHGRREVITRSDATEIGISSDVDVLRDARGIIQGVLHTFREIAPDHSDSRLARQADIQRTLYRLTDRLQRAGDLSAVSQAALDSLFEALNCDRASILLFNQQEEMEFIAWRGLSDLYRKTVQNHSPWSRQDADAKPLSFGNVETSDLDDFLKAAILAEGIGALAFYPLIAEGRLIGKFMVYYDTPHVFRDDEVRLGLTIARQLSFGAARMSAKMARAAAEEDLRREQEKLRQRVAELEAIMQSVPAAVWLTHDPGCSVITGNASTYAIFGQPAGTNLAALPLEAPDPAFEVRRGGRRAALEELPLHRAVRGEYVRDMDLEIVFADGTLRHLLGNATPMRDGNGRIFGAIAAFLDVSERKRYAEAQEHLASIVEYSDDAIISKDLTGTILSWNRGAERLFGYTSAEAVGKSITMLIPAHRLQEEPEILGRISSGERIDHYETVRRRKDGTLVDISLTISPMRNGNGEIVAASKIARNISERKRADAERSLLIAELNHRVKNTLATVISIARQSFAGADIGEARAAFDARIRGLAQTHGCLAEANWESMPLETLFADEFAPYLQSESRNVTLLGPSVDLSPKCALTLGLAIHELVTNAAKYGALSTDSGTVDVTWSIDPRDRSLNISWVEKGGPAVTPPLRSGFGRLLLERALVSDLRSEVHLDFDPDGLRWQAGIPAPQYSVRM